MRVGDPTCRGLSDKLYWRQPYDTVETVFHCFKKAQGQGYLSLCGKFFLQYSGGQASRRPEPILRCGICDGREMDRRGWDESGPTLEPRLNQRIE